MRTTKSFGVLALSTALTCLLLLMDGAGRSFASSSSSSSSSSSARELQKWRAQERALKNLNILKVKNFMESKGTKASLFIQESGIGIGKLHGADFSKMSTGETIKTIVDTVVPIIAEVLVFIPGFGPLISGIFSGVWGLVSSFFGEPQKSPLELFAEQVEKEFQNIRKEMREMRKEVLDTTAKRTEQRLRKLVTDMVGSELTRNSYICDKYAAASDEMSAVLKSHSNISVFLQAEITMYLHDCDNFLKDTSEAFFAHIDFVDVLWIPSVMTTLARVSFLSEVINHGPMLRLKRRVLLPFYDEVKADVAKQLWYYGKYVAMRMESLPGNRIMTDQIKVIQGNLTKEEFEVCAMQQSVLYVDSDLYPFGTPSHKEIVHGNDSHVYLDKYVVANAKPAGRPVHVQVFYKQPRYDPTGRHLDFINCFMGPTIARVPKHSMTVGVTFVTKKTYVVRVLYITQVGTDRVYVREPKSRRLREDLTPNLPPSKNEGVRLSLREQKARNIVEVVMEGGKPNADVDRFEYPTQYFHTSCTNYEYNMWEMTGQSVNSGPNPYFEYFETCSVLPESFYGNFVIESIPPFAVTPEKKGQVEAEGRITVENKYKQRVQRLFIVGLEVIVLPLESGKL